MDKDDDGRIVQILEFTVRNDKFRGIVLEKFATDDNEYYFKYQDQPIHRHSDRMQRIIRIADVKRTKKIRIDVAEFAFEYFLHGTATFKSIPLSSINQQIVKVCDLNVNKEVGLMKRSVTVAQNKPRKILERNSKILQKMEEAEKYYQEQRSKRIHELFGPRAPVTPRGPTAPQSPGSQGQSSPQGPGAQSQSSTQSLGAQGQSSSQVRVATVAPQVQVTQQASVADDDFEMHNIDEDIPLPLSDEDF